MSLRRSTRTKQCSRQPQDHFGDYPDQPWQSRGPHDHSDPVQHLIRLDSTLYSKAFSFDPQQPHNWYQQSQILRGSSGLIADPGVQSWNFDQPVTQSYYDAYQGAFVPYDSEASVSTNYGVDLPTVRCPIQSNAQHLEPPLGSYQSLDADLFGRALSNNPYYGLLSEPVVGDPTHRAATDLGLINQQLGGTDLERPLNRLVEERHGQNDPSRVAARLQTLNLPTSSGQPAQASTEHSHTGSRHRSECHTCGKSFDTHSKLL